MTSKLEQSQEYICVDEIIDDIVARVACWWVYKHGTYKTLDGDECVLISLILLDAIRLLAVSKWLQESNVYGWILGPVILVDNGEYLQHLSAVLVPSIEIQ